MGDKSYFSKVFWRYLLFVILLLIVYPIIAAFLFDGTNLLINIKSSFRLLEFSILITACIGIFLLISKKKFEKQVLKNGLRMSYTWIIFSVILLLLSFYPYYNFNSFLSEGIGISQDNELIDSISYEQNSWFNLPLLELSENPEQIFIDGKDYSDKKFAKIIYLNKVPENPQIRWYGSWKGSLFNDGVFNPNVKLIMTINGHEYNISSNYAQIPEYQIGFMILNISKEHLVKGKNEFIISASSEGRIGEDIGILSQSSFINKQSFIFNGKDFIPLDNQEFILYVKTENNFIYRLLFNLSFILRILSMVALFVGIFGKKFIQTLKNAKYEFLYSIVGLYLITLFYFFTEKIYFYLNQITSLIMYLGLKISGFAATISINTQESVVGIGQSQINVGESNTAALYMSFFLIIFAILIITKWDEFKIKKALLYHLIGLILIFFINVITLSAILLITYYQVSWVSFAEQYLHEALILIFFVIFWPLVIKRCTKSEKR